jgi:hypothetical protein
MVLAGFIVGVMATFIEIKLVNSVDFIRKIYTDGFAFVPPQWVNVAGSFTLGTILAGGNGLVALIAGITGVFLSSCYFATKRAANASGWDMDRVRGETASATEWFTENKQHFVNLGKTIMAIIKFVTLPIRGIMAANTAVHASAEKVQNKFEKVRPKRAA